MGEHIHTFLVYLSKGIDLLGSLIMLWGLISCIGDAIKLASSSTPNAPFIARMRQPRIKLGWYILWGLEIMIVGDIIHTVLDPTMHDIIVLSVIVLIRTIISYSLEKELISMRKEGERKKVDINGGK